MFSIPDTAYTAYKKLKMLHANDILAAVMKKFRPIVTTLDEINIRREAEYAIIEYKDTAYGTTHLRIGPEVTRMTDQEIVELYNEPLRIDAALAANYKHVAVEVPLGSAQIS